MKIHQPYGLEDCLTLLSELPPDATVILAGGTDLMPRYEQGRILPNNLINIKHLTELQGITETENGIEIGGLTTIEALQHSDLIRQEYPALWRSTAQFAGVQIRNRATLAGNIANASPAGDTLPSLYLYHAKLKLVSRHASRTTRLEDFLVGPGQTTQEPGELIQSIILPKVSGSSCFYKLGLRDAMAISVVNYALRYSNAEDGELTDLEITAGAVAPTIVFLDALTTAILGGETNIAAWQALIEQDIAPIDDIRASADYRRKVLGRLISHHLQRLGVGSHE
ncbi:MAG: FAD binding domain-containing protein [Lentisphaeria bacterium]|nr:FAD binding domain-containing protein [Candidatus Neomarinimicrobiota bacterium]MCF7841489.1 FAD binding domain-containing protein [Lentisphaeria bacterium]